jgi:N-acetylmuramoyl-L-alanine amidase
MRFTARYLLFFIIIALLSFCLALCLGAIHFPAKYSAPTAATLPKYTTVIIDAGHGGEDGGALSAAGLVEKDVNLEIATMLCRMLRANGVEVIMTREDDRLLYDRNADYSGRKKKLDLAARLAITDRTPDAVLVSIHMNSFTSPQYYGLQVWYSSNNDDSEVLAELIRKENKEKLQPDNERLTKCATSAINLLYNAKCPAVLVECGFLSNAQEARLFETQEYRQKVAFTIFCAITEFLEQ